MYLSCPEGKEVRRCSAAEFGLTPCRFCPLTGTRISTRKLRSCSMMPSASGRAPWAGTTPLSVLLALLALRSLRLSVCCPQPTPQGSQERGVGTPFSCCAHRSGSQLSQTQYLLFLKKILMAKYPKLIGILDMELGNEKGVKMTLRFLASTLDE